MARASSWPLAASRNKMSTSATVIGSFGTLVQSDCVSIVFNSTEGLAVSLSVAVLVGVTRLRSLALDATELFESCRRSFLESLAVRLKCFGG